MKSSENKSKRGISEIARMSAVELPKVNHIVQKDTYIDDCLFDAQSLKNAMIKADQIVFVLNRGRISLKGNFVEKNHWQHYHMMKKASKWLV